MNNSKLAAHFLSVLINKIAPTHIHYTWSFVNNDMELLALLQNSLHGKVCEVIYLRYRKDRKISQIKKLKISSCGYPASAIHYQL